MYEGVEGYAVKPGVLKFLSHHLPVSRNVLLNMQKSLGEMRRSSLGRLLSIAIRVELTRGTREEYRWKIEDA